MHSCISGIHDIVSHILHENTDLTLEQTINKIGELSRDLVNDQIFKNMYENIYWIVSCEIKLGLIKPKTKPFIIYSSPADFDPDLDSNDNIIFDKLQINKRTHYHHNYNFGLIEMIVHSNNMIHKQFFNQNFQIIFQHEENKKYELDKKRQNKITQRNMHQRIPKKTKKHQSNKFTKY
ncbi:hypothetical protein [Saudi moumouvirus]|nr:hypothetical protein [Saudi moumouvirus]